MAKEKSQQLDIELQIRTAIKTGDVRIGAKQALKACANGDAKLLIFSNNCTPEVCQAASQHNVPQYTYNGGSVELGPASGKPFIISVMAIVSQGDSSVLELKPGV
jgi:large subunit ribosomal protein L30e